jgi:predicted amidohydrolase
MKVAAIQYDIVWNDREANFTQLTPLLQRAKELGARFVVLPEMFSTGFIVDTETIGEPRNGPSATFLSTMSQELDIWIAGTCPEYDTDDPRPFNSLVISSPSGEMYRYHKIHPFTYGGEDRFYRAGTSFLTLTIEGLRVAFFICYDLRFADEFWTMANDTDLYVVPANWPTSRREHWNTLLRARAIENQAYVVGCNRVGTGGGLHYSGDSRIIDPLGQVIQAAGLNDEILVADITAQQVKDVRSRFPFLHDRR